ncbi:MAG: hypothetical protein M1438_04860 [Deltaproteobacteria bacterium]|nr:hypothetical protein [Deltaproteobacteria bacterium]
MTKRDQSVSLRQQIIDILAIGKFTARGVAEQLGVQSRAEIKQVRDALLELRQEGKAVSEAGEKGKPKLWSLAESKQSMQDKIWRAAILKTQKGQAFNIPDLGRLSGCSRDYARRYAAFLVAMQYLQPVGDTGLFTVRQGREKAAAPHWNRREEKRRRETEDGRPEQDSAGLPSPVPGPAMPVLNCQEADCPDCGVEDRRPLIISALEVNCNLLGKSGCAGFPKACPVCELGRRPQAGKIMEEMETVLNSLGEAQVLLADIFADLRLVLGMSTGQRPVPLEKTDEPEGHH